MRIDAPIPEADSKSRPKFLLNLGGSAAVRYQWCLQLVIVVAERFIAGAVEICKEKCATSLVLGKAGVPNIEHRVFLSCADPLTAPYAPLGGNWPGIKALVEELGL